MKPKGRNRAKINRVMPKKGIAAHLQINVYMVLAFSIIALVSLFLRFNIYPILTVNPTIALLGDPDSSSYLRLFDLAISNFPKMPPVMDYYSNYPWGFKPDIPPIWPYMLAAVSLPIIKALNMNPHQVAGLLVVILAMGAAIPIYYLARELYGKSVALIAAAIAPIHPFFIILSTGAIDHITLDLFFVPLVFALFFVSKRYFLEKNYRRFVVLAGLGGLFTALSMMTSLTLVLIFAIMLIPISIALFILSRENLKPVLAAFGGQFGAATLTFCLFALITPWFSSSLEFTQLSYLHIAVFGAIAIFGGINYFVLHTSIKQSTYRLIIGIIILTVVAIAFSIPHLREIILSGYYRSIGSYPLGIYTHELFSLFERGIGWAIMYYSYFIFVAPITIIYLLIKDISQRKVGFEQLFFYAMLLALGFYAVQALHYYSPYFSIFLVIGYALSIYTGASLMHNKLANTKYDYLNYDVIATIGTVVVIVIMALTTMNLPPQEISNNLIDLADYIKTYTEKPGDFYNPTKKPGYSIMCSWNDAPRLQYLSQRATVSSANHEIGITGIIASDRFYQATSEDEALNILRSLNVKYVIAGSPFAIWGGDISRIGEPGPAPDKIAGLIKQDQFNAYEQAHFMAIRLVEPIEYIQPPDTTEPLHHLRLLFISYRDRANSPLLLYEVVKGSRVVVKAAPNSPITIGAPAIHGNRRFIIWRDFGQTDDRGIFSTIVPYSTGTTGASITIEPYKIQVGGQEYMLNVTESAVTRGETINLKS